MSHVDHHKVLLSQEYRQLTGILQAPVLGAAPVSALLFQPNESGGKLAYLDRNVRADEPIWIDPSQPWMKFFLDQDDKTPWITVEGTVDSNNVTEYRRLNPEKVRLRLAEHDRARYPGITFEPDGVAQIGTRFKSQYIFPSPLFHETLGWWRRLPRLGQIYSLGEDLEHPILLLICAINTGNRALHVRLKLLLDHKNIPGRTPYAIAAAAATGNKVDDDEYVVLLCQLLLCHHWFFPYDPVALKLFAGLGVNADEVLKRHKWPGSGLDFSRGEENIQTLTGKLLKDFLFLIYACARWDVPESGRKDSLILLAELKEVLPQALGLMCGNPEFVSISSSLLMPSSDEYRESEYVHVRASEEMKRSSLEPELPMFSFAQLLQGGSNKELRIEAESFLQTLCPFDLHGAADRLKWKTVRVMRVKGDRVLGRGVKMGKWLTGYSRARCLLRILEGNKQKRLRR